MIRATQRALRLIRNDRKYATEFIKGPYLDPGKERERYAERVYERLYSTICSQAPWMKSSSAK